MSCDSCPKGERKRFRAKTGNRRRLLTEPVIHDNDNDESWLTPIRGSYFPEGAPEEERESSVALEEELDHLWKVIVWNDPVNLMSYVVYVLQKIFGHSKETATRHMLEVHHDGKSIVCTTEQEKGERYVSQLHAFGLQATLEKDG